MNAWQGKWVEFLSNCPVYKSVADALSHMPQALTNVVSLVSMDILGCFKNQYNIDLGDAFHALKSLNPTPR